MFAFSNYLVSYKVAVEAHNAEIAARIAAPPITGIADTADVIMSSDAVPDVSHAALRADINKLTAQVQALTIRLSAAPPSKAKAKAKNGSGPGRGTTNPPHSKPGPTRRDTARSASRPPPRSSSSRPKRQSSPSEDAERAKSQKRKSSSPPRTAAPDAARGRSPHRRSGQRANSKHKRSASRN